MSTQEELNYTLQEFIDNNKIPTFLTVWEEVRFILANYPSSRRDDMRFLQLMEQLFLRDCRHKTELLNMRDMALK